MATSVKTGRTVGVHARQPDALSVRGGELWVEDTSAASLVREFGSPLFVLSEGQLRANFIAFRDSFQRGWPDGEVDVMPAFKANPTLATRHLLSSWGAGADIYSPQELEGVLRTAVDPSRVSVNGGGKEDVHLRRCIEAGVRITVEDIDEVDRIQRVAAELGMRASIRLRVKLNVDNLWKPTDFAQITVPIDLAMQIYKSGIPTEYLVDIGRRALEAPNIDLVGLHVHAGRHHASTWFWRGLMVRFAALVGELSAAWGGWQPIELDVGGGMASLRDPMNKALPRSEFVTTGAAWPVLVGLRKLGRTYDAALTKAIPALMNHGEPAAPPTIEEYAEEITSTLRAELARTGVRTAGVRLQVEPGRALYGNAGMHLTKVKVVKEQTKPFPFRWVLTDTTEFFMAYGSLEHNRHPVVAVSKADQPATMSADIVGQSCYGDRLLEGAALPEVAEGDVLAFLETGAYLEASASNFNMLPRPATVLVSGASAEVIRRAETVDDVYARDVVPQRLVQTTEHDG